MVAVAKQVEIGGLDTDRDRAIEKETAYVWREQLWSAMRSFVECYIDADNGLKKHDGCAYRLNEQWESKGRPVSPGALKNALEDQSRNNFRLEWAFWFGSQSAEVAALLARHVRPAKTAEERLADLEAELREELSHKRAEAVMRRARTR